MPDVLDQIQQDQQRTTNARLVQTHGDNEWAKTFNSVPDTDKLRASRNLNDMVASALENKRRLAAQNDEGAAKLYYQNQKIQDFQETAPQRKDLLDARIAHEKALTAHLGGDETDMRMEAAGYYAQKNALVKKYGLGSDEFQSAFAELVHSVPNGRKDKDVRDDIERISKAHDEQVLLGPKVAAIKLAKDYSITPDQFKGSSVAAFGTLDAKGKFFNNYTGAESGDHVLLDTGAGKVTMPRKDFEGLSRLLGVKKNSAPVISQIPDAAVKMLQADPKLADQFDAKYGKGTSKQYLNP